MAQIYLSAFIFSITWQWHLNCIASPEANANKPNQMDIWARDVKEMLDKLANYQNSQEALNNELIEIEKFVGKMPLSDEQFWKKRAEKLNNSNFSEPEWKRTFGTEPMPLHDEEILEKRHRRLESTIFDYSNYLEEKHDGFDVYKMEPFLQKLITALGKELATFLIEYELFMVEKEVWKKENLDVLKGQINKIFGIAQRKESYLILSNIHNTKTLLFANLTDEKEIEKTVEEFVKFVKFKIFANELDAKIFEFDNSLCIYAGDFITFLEYVQNKLKLPQMDETKWGHILDETLKKINKKSKQILDQIGNTLTTFEKDIGNIQKDVQKLQKTRGNYFAELKGIGTKTIAAYAKVMADMENVGFYNHLLNEKIKKTMKKMDKLQQNHAEENIHQFIFGDEYMVKSTLNDLELCIKKAYDNIKAKVEKKSMKNEKGQKTEKKKNYVNLLSRSFKKL